MRANTELPVILETLDEAEDLAHATVELINLFLAGRSSVRQLAKVPYPREKQRDGKETFPGVRIVNVLFRSHEDAGALLSGLLVDKDAVNFGVDAVGTGVLPITADLQKYKQMVSLGGDFAVRRYGLCSLTLRTRQLSHY